jgi:hypothetical protein
MGREVIFFADLHLHTGEILQVRSSNRMRQRLASR